jgi:hypothetical protein
MCIKVYAFFEPQAVDDLAEYGHGLIRPGSR